MKRSRIFIVLLASLFIVAATHTPRVSSCAVGPYDSVLENELIPSDISFFQSDLGYDVLLSKYLYITHSNSIENDSSLEEPVNTESQMVDANIQEWKTFLNNKSDIGDILDFIYHHPKSTLEKIRQKIVSSQPLGEDDTSFYRYVRESKQPQILDYMIFVRQCEPYVVYTGDPWDSEEQLKKIRDVASMQSLINEGLSLYKQTKAAFLKLRYAYQIIRLANYAGFYDDCVRYYESLIPANVNSVYLYRSMLLKAGALAKIGKEAESLNLISQVFDQCVPLMDSAFYEFRLPSPESWDQCLQLAGNKHRQATLWLLWALKDNQRLNMEPLVQMVQAEPKSPRNEVILSRYINNIEKTLLTPEYFFPVSTPASKDAYISDLHEFIGGLDLTTLRHPALWQTAQGYLDLLLKEYDEAEGHFNTAAGSDSGIKGLQEQLALLRNLLLLSRSNEMTPELENAVLPTLNSISNWKPTYNRPIVKRSFLILIAQKYIRNRQFAKAYYCIDKTGYADLPISLLKDAADIPEIDAIIALAEKKQKTPMERWLTRNAAYGTEDLYYVRGTKLLKQERFQEALTSYEKVSPKTMARYDTIPLVTSFEKAYYNPKTGLYNLPVKNPPSFSKTAFLQKVNSLLDYAKKNPARADLAYFKIANGFFHTPAWSYYNFDKYFPWFDTSSENPSYPFFDKDLNDHLSDYDIWGSTYPQRIIAWKFYEKALQSTKNPELAAECAFMAAACQTRFSRQDAFTPKGKGRIYYYNVLKQKYENTAYYKRVVKECADLKKYLNRK